MIDNEIIKKAGKLLNEGRLSQRKIAKLLGISNTMVSLIHRQRRKPYSEPSGSPIAEPVGPATRCPVCGAMSQSPCVLCQIREYLKKNGVTSRLRGGGKEEIVMELRPEHARRYEEVRRWRASQPDPYFIDIPEDWPWRSRQKREKGEMNDVMETIPAGSGSTVGIVEK